MQARRVAHLAQAAQSGSTGIGTGAAWMRSGRSTARTSSSSGRSIARASVSGSTASFTRCCARSRSRCACTPKKNSWWTLVNRQNGQCPRLNPRLNRLWAQNCFRVASLV